DEPFATLEPFDGADLETLVHDIGPMPATLAAAYGRQVALAVQAAHVRGLTHGDVRAGVIFVGPLVPMSRPRADGSTRFRAGPTAIVNLSELGLVRRRDQEATPADDVLGLGTTLQFLLTGRQTAGDGPSLESSRPDLPAELSAFIRDMTAADPGTRPSIAVV